MYHYDAMQHERVSFINLGGFLNFTNNKTVLMYILFRSDSILSFLLLSCETGTQ